MACREITNAIPASNIDVVLKDGNLMSNPDLGTLCTGFQVDAPFDVADYPYSAPTYYFLGEVDPATPLWQGNYHFENNLASPRTLVTVAFGGHAPLHHNFASDSEPCTLHIVESIAHGGTDLDDALASCRRPSTVERREASEDY